MLCDQATVERRAIESTSEKTRLDVECSQLRRQIKELKETLLKETQTWETDRTSLSRQLELVHLLIPVVFSVDFIQLTEIYYCLPPYLLVKCSLVRMNFLEKCSQIPVF